MSGIAETSKGSLAAERLPVDAETTGKLEIAAGRFGKVGLVADRYTMMGFCITCGSGAASALVICSAGGDPYLAAVGIVPVTAAVIVLAGARAVKLLWRE